MVSIPVNQINEGMQLCARNIRRFILDHYLLLRDGSDWHAAAMAVYALEELTKYSELKKAKESAKGSIVELDERLFGRGRRSHQFKIEIGRKLIPSDAMNIFPASFDPANFDPRYFQTKDIIVSPALRAESLFVDWRDWQWSHGTPLLPDRLKNLVDQILQALNNLETSGASTGI